MEGHHQEPPVTFHYDLSNEFYKLWFDERMIYSCAMFGNVDEDLERVQQCKLEPSVANCGCSRVERLLDINCGRGDS